MQNKKIAIVTGATGGIGKAFVKELIHQDLDEIWCIARNLDKLNDLKNELGDSIVLFSLDLTQLDSIEQITQRLQTNDYEIKYLINNAGIGDIITTLAVTDIHKTQNTINLNCTAVVMLCNACITYMKPHAKILNLASQASFQPLPYANLYAATKAFVTSYSRALNFELKPKDITVTAVCPGWVDTELLAKTSNGMTIKYPHIIKPELVAIQAIKDANRNKDMSVITYYVKWTQLLTKIFPHRWAMKFWVKTIKKYL